MSFYHQPVLLKEVIANLNLKPGATVIDATVGEAGHASAILEKIGPKGRMLALDWDAQSLKQAKKKLEKCREQVTFACGNFADLHAIALQNGFHQVNAILLDLGLSSYQLEVSGRGFSFQKAEKLDMRFAAKDLDETQAKRKARKLEKLSSDLNLSNLRRRLGSKITAADILNKISEEELVWLLRFYADESRAKVIARQVTAARAKRPFQFTTDLTNLPVFGQKSGALNPATKTFMALRMAVNRELNNVKKGLTASLELLAKNGRLAVISFHSKEDKIVKNFMQRETYDCLCPPETPECRCNHHRTLTVITNKPIVPTAEEVKNNPRSRSAKLRVAEKI